MLWYLFAIFFAIGIAVVFAGVASKAIGYFFIAAIIFMILTGDIYLNGITDISGVNETTTGFTNASNYTNIEKTSDFVYSSVLTDANKGYFVLLMLMLVFAAIGGAYYYMFKGGH